MLVVIHEFLSEKSWVLNFNFIKPNIMSCDALNYFQILKCLPVQRKFNAAIVPDNFKDKCGCKYGIPYEASVFYFFRLI